MPDVPEIPRPSQLWKRLPPERKQLAADAFWQDENAAAEQAEAIALIAQRIKFRVRSVQTLPREKKSRHLINLGAVSEMVAARLLVAYHLWCGSLLRAFAAGRNRRSHVWLRWFNEVPVVILLATVLLVVVKPF